jgi:hypothetical protein
VQVVELVEVPEEPVLDGEPGGSLLSRDVGVGDRGRLAFPFELGEVFGVVAGVAERVGGQVEVELFAEPSDVGGGRGAFDERFVALVGFGQGHLGVAENRVDGRRLVLLAAGVADFVAFAQHQPRHVGVDQALGRGLAGAVPFGRRGGGETEQRDRREDGCKAARPGHRR